MPQTPEQIQSAFGDCAPAVIKRLASDGAIRDAVENGLDAIEQGSLSWAKVTEMQGTDILTYKISALTAVRTERVATVKFAPTHLPAEKANILASLVD